MHNVYWDTLYNYFSTFQFYIKREIFASYQVQSAFVFRNFVFHKAGVEISKNCQGNLGPLSHIFEGPHDFEGPRFSFLANGT